MPRRVALALLCIAASTVSCAGDAGARVAHWRPFIAVRGVVDVTAARSDGRLTVAVAGHLGLLRPGGGAPAPFARGYRTSTGEPYIALSPGQRVAGARCAFHREDVYALEPSAAPTRPSVIRVDTAGRVRRVALLPAGTFPNGLAFDTAGAFGHRLLVTAGIGGGRAALYALDCRNRRRTVAAQIPGVEGGMAIAPLGFGRFGGRLIAPDELHGRLIAVDGRGRAVVLARSGLPAGGDVGVESLGFVPPGFARGMTALLADRAVPGAPHPGTDSILGVSGAALRSAGVRAGDLLAATEGGGETIAVRCGARACTVRLVAHGPAVTHAEGHLVFARAR
jgi:hypothetical protein